MRSVTESIALTLSASQIEDLRLASSKMTGVGRRSFQAAMVLRRIFQFGARLIFV